MRNLYEQELTKKGRTYLSVLIFSDIVFCSSARSCLSLLRVRYYDALREGMPGSNGGAAGCSFLLERVPSLMFKQHGSPVLSIGCLANVTSWSIKLFAFRILCVKESIKYGAWLHRSSFLGKRLPILSLGDIPVSLYSI